MLRLDRPVPLFNLRVISATGTMEQYESGNNVGASYDVLPDGRFVMVRSALLANTREVVLVQNGPQELRRLAAAQ